ncbi:hypothetical protein BASA61_003946 [Batrachochytrium salamandrivorans]|nr:hypothetical protein BASA62_010325 [Batrachochytrium salamandrivorans]KAH6594870.1 hypothetical protein BASA61_003946 [Batrachochytrium salamandrivorans]
MTSLYRSVVLLLSVATIQVQATKWDVEGIKGGYHQKQPKLQLTDLQVYSPSSEAQLLHPTCAKRLDTDPYSRMRATNEYREFVEKEEEYFKTEYQHLKDLSKGMFDDVHLAIKRSSGLKVIYKVIKPKDIVFNTPEVNPPSECHSTEISPLDGKHAGAGCMSPRPQTLLIPLEAKMQEYLTQPRHNNPYVLGFVDYIITEGAVILVLEYSGEDWVAFDEYMTEHGIFSVDEVRLILKEVITALAFLKNLGILHGNIVAKNILYNEKTGSVKLVDFVFSEPLKGCNQDSSAQTESSGAALESSEHEPDSEDKEARDIKNIGNLMYLLLTLGRSFKNIDAIRARATEEFKGVLGDPESQLTINAANLVTILLGYGTYQITSIEDALEHSFFTN